MSPAELGIVTDLLNPTPPELLDPRTTEANAPRVAPAEVNGLLLDLSGNALAGLSADPNGAAVAHERILPVNLTNGTLLSLWALYSFHITFPATL